MSMLSVPELLSYSFSYFLFNDTATTEIYTLSLHDALPISVRKRRDFQAGRGCATHGASARGNPARGGTAAGSRAAATRGGDRKSTRLNSSHSSISYAVFCLKKKKKLIHINPHDKERSLATR